MRSMLQSARGENIWADGLWGQQAVGSHAVTLRNKTKSTELGVILRGGHALTPEGQVNKVSVDAGFIKPRMQGDGQPHLKCMVLAHLWM